MLLTVVGDVGSAITAYHCDLPNDDLNIQNIVDTLTKYRIRLLGTPT